MPNILFASNNLSHFPTSSANSNSNAFDGNRVPYAIGVVRGQVLNSPTFVPAVGEETWFHSRIYLTSIETRVTDAIFSAFDAAGNRLFYVNKRFENGGRSGSMEIRLYDGSTSQLFYNNTNPTTGIMQFFDFRYRVNGLLIELEMFVNGASVGSTSFNSNPAGFGKPVRFSIGGGLGRDASNPMNWSEIIVADGDTRNARLNLLRPLAGGTYEQWNGQLGTLADDDTTTGLTTIAANQRHTMTMSPYLGAPNISNVVTLSSTTRGQNSPTKLQHSVRLSGVDYDSPVIHDIGFPLEFQISDYQFNPATSLPWTSDDLTAIETGFVSRA